MKNFQTIKPKILDLVNQALKKHKLQIYDINNFQDFENDVLQILVEDMNETNRPLDFDTLVVVNEEISELLDQLNDIKDPYLLEVASAGIEKEIRTFEELKQALNNYLHVEFKTPINQVTVVEGNLKSFDPAKKEFKIEYFVKGQPKKIVFEWEMIETARYAVKF